VVGCRDQPATASRTSMSASDLTTILTGEAAAHVDGHGGYVLPAARAPDDVPMITAERAKELAVAFVHTYGRSHAPGWAMHRGAPLSTAGLRVSHRVFYAESPFGRVPDGYGWPRRVFGPWYIVTFEDGGEPVLGVAVSAYSTDVAIENGILLEPALDQGERFVSRAVALSPGVPAPYTPVSPEQAVKIAAERTGRRVSDVPRLVLRNAAWHPLYSLWHVSLDREIWIEHRAVKGSSAPGARERVREIFVGASGGTLFAPGRLKRTAEQVPVRTGWGERGKVSPHVVITVPYRGGASVDYDEVTVTPAGGEL
jgi:hypothetical protein